MGTIYNKALDQWEQVKYNIVSYNIQNSYAYLLWYSIKKISPGTKIKLTFGYLFQNSFNFAEFCFYILFGDVQDKGVQFFLHSVSKL